MKRFARLDKFRSHPDLVIGAAIFVGALALYIRTAAPTLGGAFDSEEFQQVAYTLGIAHATGYPLYLLIGKFFTTLVPIGNVAYRMNLLSALLSAGAAVLVYLNALALTRRHIASLAAAALFATNPAVWRQAGVVSVGPLHLLLVAAIVYALLLWRDQRAPLTLAAFLFGLGLAHHRTVLLLAPAIAIFVLLVDANILRRPRAIAKNLFWLALSLLLYLYLPIFGSHSPWYSNTLQGFIAEISGGEAGDFIRATPMQLLEGIGFVAQYLFDSFGYLGAALIVIGAVSVVPRWNRWAGALGDSRVLLFLGLATLPFVIWGTLYAGEPDRYLVMPFVFLIYWFAIGAGTLELFIERAFRLPIASRAAQIAFAALLAFLVLLPFPDRFRVADWSSFDRVYKQWDEIFSLPIPRGAVLVGNWGQLNAMRYMQRVENRRPDLQFVGTLYDLAPQTDAARAALADGRAIFLSPGIAQPTGDYRYALLGPLLQVRDTRQTQPPAAQKNIAVNSALTLADFGVTTALEPFAPTESIAPGRTARVTLDWRAESAVKNFLVRLQLYDPEARLVAQKDEPPVRGLYAAAQWQPGEYVSDVHNFLIPPGAPPGAYQLKMQTLDTNTKELTSGEIALVTLNVARATNLARDQVFIQQPLDIPLSDRVELWGVGGLESPRRAGETIGISLLWHVREDVGADFAARIALIDPSGKLISEWQRAPISFCPTREWRQGEILKAYYDLPLPDNLPGGDYSLSVNIGGGAALIGKIQIVP
jgi:hypothetical protein